MKNLKIISIILLSLLLLTSCETLQNKAKEITREYIEENKPEIKVKKASIANVTFKDITLDVLLNIKNNFPFELPLDRIDIELINTDNKVFTKANTVQTLKIPSKQSEDVNMEFNAKYIDVFTTAFGSIKNQNFKCTAQITLTFTIQNMKFQIPYTKELTFIE
ncbi:hypothetical protein [Brachyspira sp. SAP_772]|uniref:hypothetical protein n=1 Tax=Brachyspira sp. SAP_772 TaxID=2608385 RepID=UPI0012F4C651|nr:hypothetical protein [Brachyspira sp. SAP_772]